MDMLSLGCRGPQERTSHEISGAPRVREGPVARGTGPSPVGAEDTSAFTLAARLGPLMELSESCLKCLRKENFAGEIRV